MQNIIYCSVITIYYLVISYIQPLIFMSTALDQPLGIAQVGQLGSRGENIIDNIRSLQQAEIGLFNQLQTGSSDMTLTSSQMQDLTNQIKSTADARYNLYNELQQNQDYYQENIGISHNILTQETDALEVVENELQRAEQRIGLIREQRANRLRLVEINRYYGDKYKQHTLILQYITVVFSLILLITYIYNKGFIPPFIYTTLFVIIGSVGAYYIIKEMWDAYTRDNMMYEQYNWKLINGDPDKKVEATNQTNPFQESEAEIAATCVGQSCCRTESTWVPDPINKCYPNSELKSPEIMAQFPNGITPYNGGANASAVSENVLMSSASGQQMESYLKQYN